MTQCEEDEEWGGRRGEKEEEKKMCARESGYVCLYIKKAQKEMLK